MTTRPTIAAASRHTVSQRLCRGVPGVAGSMPLYPPGGSATVPRAGGPGHPTPENDITPGPCDTHEGRG